MNLGLQTAHRLVRGLMRRAAAVLNRLSRGKLRPDMVTLAGFAVHLPIAFLIATSHNILAAILLIIFGLFDTLDGELARLQNKASPRGMLLDAATDRMKEVLLYTGAAYALALGRHPATAAWAAAAVGASLCVSYVKAKGEAAVVSSGRKISHAKLNHLFGGGILSFEIRMVILIIGLFAGELVYAVAIIAVLASLTAVQRLIKTLKQID
ncbi:MAG: CDP-alcohol phosphatidyltransferase family protein [Candidatus Saccharimonadales bacterium]